MLQVNMTASVRSEKGKGAMRRLRSGGKTPAVMYGIGEESVCLELETQELMQKLLKYYRKNTVVTLNIDNEGEKSVLIKDVQTDPIKDTLVHVDFQEIDLEKPRKFNVPLEFVGVAKGIDLGGIQNISLNSLVLQGKPLDIPDSCAVEVGALGIGDGIKVGDIAMPADVELLTSKDSVCVQIEAHGASAK